MGAGADGDLAGGVQGLVHQSLMRDHAIDQAPVGRRFGVNAAAGEQHFGGAGVADVARQAPGAAVAGNDAELQEGHAETGAVRGDADVGRGGDAAAQAHGRAVDGRNQRNLQIIERPDDAMHHPAVTGANLGSRSGEQVAAIPHGGQVAAGGKGAAGPGQHHAFHRHVRIGAGAGLGEGVAVLGVRQGVQPRLPIQRPDQDRALPVFGDQAHASSPLLDPSSTPDAESGKPELQKPRRNRGFFRLAAPKSGQRLLIV